MTDTAFTHVTVHPPDCRCVEGRAPEPREKPDEEAEPDTVSLLEEQ